MITYPYWVPQWCSQWISKKSGKKRDHRSTIIKTHLQRWDSSCWNSFLCRSSHCCSISIFVWRCYVATEPSGGLDNNASTRVNLLILSIRWSRRLQQAGSRLLVCSSRYRAYSIFANLTTLTCRVIFFNPKQILKASWKPRWRSNISIRFLVIVKGVKLSRLSLIAARLRLSRHLFLANGKWNQIPRREGNLQVLAIFDQNCYGTRYNLSQQNFKTIQRRLSRTAQLAEHSF